MVGVSHYEQFSPWVRYSFTVANVVDADGFKGSFLGIKLKSVYKKYSLTVS